MSQVNYKVYVDSTLLLARSIVIKFSSIADTLNNNLLNQGYTIDVNDPTKWKYYLNLAGEYHASDTMMQVKSLDTLEVIDFTRENLLIHRATFRAYASNSVYYKALLNQYPDQAVLINGIINPVDMQTAIAAPDGKIVGYDKTLVESNEDNLIQNLQIWINNYLITGFNHQYTMMDDLYLPASIGVMWANIPYAIMLIRKNNVHTPYVHSFHMREYFASNNGLDKYLPYMATETKFYLYRNIRYIQRNAGRNETLHDLIDHVLTPSRITVNGYALRQNTEKMPEELYPEAELVPIDIKTGHIIEGADKVTIAQLLKDERSLARYNADVETIATQDITDKVSSSAYSTLPTKVINSSMLDRTDVSVRRLDSVLLANWIYLTSTNKYRAYIYLQNPNTGNTMQLSMREALVIFMYTYLKTRGLEADVIPPFPSYRVLRPKLPCYQELLTYVDQNYVIPELVRYVADGLTPHGDYISTEAFYDASYKQHGEFLAMWQAYALREHFLTRSMLKNVVMANYMDILCDIVPAGTTFADYFDDNQIDIMNLNQVDLESLFVSVYEMATGKDINTTITAGDRQANLMEMMDNLCSYPVQFLYNMELSDFDVADVGGVRVGDVVGSLETTYSVDAVDVTIQSAVTQADLDLSIPMDVIVPPTDLSIQNSESLAVDLTVGVTADLSDMGDYVVSSGNITVNSFSFTLLGEVNVH